MLEEGGQESSGSAVQEWSIEEEREGVDKWVESNISKINVEGVLMSKPIACKLGGGKAPRLSEVHCDRDSVCVKTDT